MRDVYRYEICVPCLPPAGGTWRAKTPVRLWPHRSDLNIHMYACKYCLYNTYICMSVCVYVYIMCACAETPIRLRLHRSDLNI